MITNVFSHAVAGMRMIANKHSSMKPRLAVFSVASALSIAAVLGLSLTQAPPQPELRSTIVVASTRDFPNARALGLGEIYLLNPDGTAARRLTTNSNGDAFPVLSPDGEDIVFDSNRSRRPREPANTSDLFLMKNDGRTQKLLTRGSSASWSPDSKSIVFHASASGTGKPIFADAGAPAPDSDLFVAKVGELLDFGPGRRTNITNTPNAIEDDADWSPVSNKIIFTSRPLFSEDPLSFGKAEIYLTNLDTKEKLQLTNDPNEQVAGPEWSPDGKHIAFMCRPASGAFSGICVMKDDGSDKHSLTDNDAFHATPVWSPDGKKILFMEQLDLPPGEGARPEQLFVMNADGSAKTQLTTVSDGYINTTASWGLLRVTPP